MSIINERVVQRQLDESARVKSLLSQTQAAIICQIAQLMVTCYLQGNKVILMGNGGSAADAQHIAAELVGRFQLSERRPLPAIALNTNTSIITAIGNDYGFVQIFSRQVEALVQPGDVVIGIGTSGNSPNVIKAIELAKAKAARTIALVGQRGGRLSEVADVALKVPSEETPRIQEAHMTIGHILCDLVERELCGSETREGRRSS